MKNKGQWGQRKGMRSQGKENEEELHEKRAG